MSDAPTHFLNTSDLLGPEWRFLAEHSRRPDITWATVSGSPQTALEARIRRPNLARWRAGWQAATLARQRPGAILVSHLPRMSAVQNLWRRALCPTVPQIAFAFNFTDLPQGWQRGYFRRALAGVAEFVVFSRFEQALYAELFDLAPERLHFIPWAMSPPETAATSPLPADLRARGYFCAVGGEGRDYRILAGLMAQRPSDRLVIVARPHSVAGIAFPDNVTLYQNLPLPQTWRLAVESRAMILPLRDARTACGHITIVGAQQLGIPLIASRSQGIADYVQDGVTAALFDPGDGAGLARAVEAWHDDPARFARLAETARAAAETRSDLARWVAHFEAAADRLRR